MKNTTTYAIKWESKKTGRVEYDTCGLRSGNKIRVYKSKEAAEKQVAKYRALGNDTWEITVIENN